MSTQCSETVPAHLSTLYLTRDGTAGGTPLLVLFKYDDWSRYRTNETEVAGGVEAQSQDVGGSSGTLHWPVEFEIPVCPDVVFWGLFGQRNQLNPVVASSVFPLAATDAAGAERSLPFSSLRWLSLTHDSAPSATERFAARFYRKVEARLISEA